MDGAMHAPVDRYKLVYVVFVMLGIGTLLPWNFFITVHSYWMYKFRDTPVAAQASVAATAATTTTSPSADNQTTAAAAAEEVGVSYNAMQTNWGPQLSVASMVPNVTILLLNAVFGHRFRTQPRLLVSLILVIVLFAFTAAMSMVDSDDWQEIFLYVTLASAVFININAAIFQSGLLGVAGKFPPKYIGGVFSGQAVGGIFAATTSVIMIMLGADPQYNAFFCFLFAVAFLTFSLVLYVWLTKSEFFQHYLGETSKVECIGAKEVEKATAENGHAPEQEKLMDGPHPPPVKVVIPVRVNPLLVFKQIFLYAFSVYFVFTVTLACFPATTMLAESVNKKEYTTWAENYFIPVCCFVLFNVGDYVGRFIAEIVQWPKPGKMGMILVTVASLSRLAFIPLFLFCNVTPNNRQVTSVLFHSDTAYIVVMALFSISNGYLANICMISAPQICIPEEQQTAASLMVALLGLGLGSGALLQAAVTSLL